MKMSLRQYCIEHGRDTLLREWDAARNGGLTPSDVSFGSHQKVWWQCSKGHSWQAKVYSRSAGSGCPYCTGRKEVPENSLAVQVPSLEAEWDAEKNAPLKFADLTIGSHKKVWWRCPAGHSYDSVVKSRVLGTGCPVCAGRVVLPDENSLAARYPALVAEWDTEKNAPLLPTLVAPGTVRKAWWRCPKGHSYRAAISSRAGGGTGLPILRRAKGHTGRKRPRYPIPTARRAMGRCKKRHSDAGGSDFRLQPPRVVALRKGTFLSGCYSSPRAEWKRLSVLLQPQGSARLQRPRDDRAGRCLAMAPDAQRQPYTAAGDARQPPQGLVALR